MPSALCDVKGLALKNVKWQQLPVWFECLVPAYSRCHRHGEWTDAAWRVVPPRGPRGNAVVSRLGNYHKPRLFDECRDCFPLMWPASLRVLLWQLAVGVTENKWGVFSCSWCWYGEGGANWEHRKGGFPKQWEDCALVLPEEEREWVLCKSHRAIQCSCSASTPHPTPLSCTETLPRSVSLSFFLPVGLACDGMPPQRKFAGVSGTDRTSPWITAAGSHTNQENGCVCSHCAWYRIVWVVVDPALQQIQSDSGNWMQCDHYSRSPSPIGAEPCIRGHYITPSALFSVSVTHWDCSVESQGIGS